MRQSKRGLTLVELLIGMIVIVIFLAIAIPAFYTMLRRSELDAAARQVMGDLRAAQSRASLTGWQYRLIGFDINSFSPYRNQYRLVGRSSTAVAWPSETSATFTSATQMAGQWTNVNTVFPNIRIDTSDATNRYWVSFNSQGGAFETNSFPLNMAHKTSGQKQCLAVTTAGSIRMVNKGTAGCP